MLKINTMIRKIAALLIIFTTLTKQAYSKDKEESIHASINIFDLSNEYFPIRALHTDIGIICINSKNQKVKIIHSKGSVPSEDTLLAGKKCILQPTWIEGSYYKNDKIYSYKHDFEKTVLSSPIEHKINGSTSIQINWQIRESKQKSTSSVLDVVISFSQHSYFSIFGYLGHNLVEGFNHAFWVEIIFVPFLTAGVTLWLSKIKLHNEWIKLHNE